MYPERPGRDTAQPHYHRGVHQSSWVWDGGKQAWVQVLALLLLCWKTLNKLLKLPELWFLTCEQGYK